jgi:DNA polymerase-3 subunit epsilon/ATP-dependent DNA helicase DinG
MRDILVAVDLETTGLDPSYDRIIEIGAVRFQQGEVLDEWRTFVNPGFPIPPAITQLTGIRDQDVERAPHLAAVLPSLRRFMGNATLIGHNVSFDLGFLRVAGLRLDNAVIDTYALASVLLPDVPRYNLSALAAYLGVQSNGAHRALNDAHVTCAVYWELWKRAFTLPLDMLAEIVQAGEQMPWDGRVFFKAVLQERSREVVVAPQPEVSEESSQEEALVDLPQELDVTPRPRRTLPRPLDVDALAALIEPGGTIEAAFPGYEYRPQQVTMLKAVGRAFNEGQHLLIEAPTGVGKSMAYLIPAAVFAVQNGERVVISTNTINLQEQLISKDIPLLQSILGIPFRAAVLKGRGNYLCPRRLAALRRRGPTSPEEMLMLAKLLVWRSKDRSGERNRLTLRGPIEAGIWQRLSAEDEGCTIERCAQRQGEVCPFYRARLAAENAHLVIVNHALLLSDVVTEGHVLPDYRCLIIDEAHHLEDAVTNSLSFRTDPESLKREIAELGTLKTGLLGEVLKRCQGAIPQGYFNSLSDYVSIVVRAATDMQQHIEWLFETLQSFLERHVHLPRNEYVQQARIVDALRRQPGWVEVEQCWGNLSHFTSAIADAMVELAHGLAELREYEIEQYGDLLAGVGSAANHLSQLHKRLHEIVEKPDPNMIYWAEFQPDGQRISLHAAPLDVGPLVQKHLWLAKETVVMTSATLRTGETFDYIRERLDADHAEELAVDSPFDYQSSTLLYLVNDIPEPSDQIAYQRAVERGLLSLCRATQGRTMVLFTSYAQLRETVKAIGEALARDGIMVYDQNEGVSRTQLLDGFVQTEKAVLFGTRSFWEGVDVPGPDLSVLVIVRLPFAVPSDPLFAARSELFDNAFAQYALPETILRFRQGFGRLIRRKDDRGVVAVFDRRIVSKSYGQQFLNSLPACTVRQGRLAELPQVAVDWLRRQ